jgi:hypothetical protein
VCGRGWPSVGPGRYCSDNGIRIENTTPEPPEWLLSARGQHLQEQINTRNKRERRLLLLLEKVLTVPDAYSQK